MGKLKLVMSAAAACFAVSTPAWAQPASTPAQPSNAAPAANDEVVVTGTHSDETRIDRHVYSVRNDPIAQTSSLNDILAKIPAVTVAPSGQIRLLGSSPTIQIDGITVPNATLAQVLRTMTGDQIDRIEVITNPSAQYSASASGGIINIVTRLTFGRGIGGTLTGSYDTTNSYVLTLAPTWTRGPFSLSGRAGYNRSLSHSETTTRRDVFATNDPITEIGLGRQNGYSDNAYFSFGYRPSNHVNANASIEHSESNYGQVKNVTDTDAVGPLFTQDIHSPFQFKTDRAVVGYNWNGAHNGESLTFSGTVQRFDVLFVQTTLTQPASGPATAFASPGPSNNHNASFKLDYQRPFGARLFTAGASYDFNQSNNTSGFITLIGPPSPNDFQETLHGRQTTPAVYATYQFPIGHLTFLPGVRVEDFQQDVHSTPAHARLDDVRVFPTLHVRRNLMPGLDLDASFTRRISHPGIGSFDPALRFTDGTHAFGGNPNLQPSLTNAFELSLNYVKGLSSVGLIFYDRITDDTVSSAIDVTPDGIIVSRPINAGTNETRGAQISVAQPLGHNWRLTTTVNFLDRSFEQLSSGVTTREDDFEYNGNATLEYRDPDQNRVGAQQIQFTTQFSGPVHDFQSTYGQYAVAGVTWRRTLTDRVAGQLQLYDVFASGRNRNAFRTDQIEETSVTRNFGNGGGRRLQFVLTYKLADPRATGASGAHGN